MADIYKFDAKKVRKSVRQKRSSGLNFGVGEYVKYGSELAKGFAALAESGGLVCSLGLCNKEGDFDLEKGVKFLVVAAVFFLGVGFLRDWWRHEKAA